MAIKFEELKQKKPLFVLKRFDPWNEEVLVKRLGVGEKLALLAAVQEAGSASNDQAKQLTESVKIIANLIHDPDGTPWNKQKDAIPFLEAEDPENIYHLAVLCLEANGIALKKVAEQVDAAKND